MYVKTVCSAGDIVEQLEHRDGDRSVHQSEHYADGRRVFLIVGAWCLWVFISTLGLSVGAVIAEWTFPSALGVFGYPSTRYLEAVPGFVLLASTPFAVLQTAILFAFAHKSEQTPKRLILWIPITALGFAAMFASMWTIEPSIGMFADTIGLLWLISIPTAYLQWRFVVSAYRDNELEKKNKYIAQWLLLYSLAPFLVVAIEIGTSGILPINAPSLYTTVLFYAAVGFSYGFVQAWVLVAIFVSPHKNGMPMSHQT